MKAYARTYIGILRYRYFSNKSLSRIHYNSESLLDGQTRTKNTFLLFVCRHRCPIIQITRAKTCSKSQLVGYLFAQSLASSGQPVNAVSSDLGSLLFLDGLASSLSVLFLLFLNFRIVY